MNLYHITQEYRLAAEHLASLDIDEQTLKDTLEGMSGALEVKARNVAIVARNIEAMAEAAGKAAEELAQRAKSMQKRADALRDYLLVNLQLAGISKIEPTADQPYFKIAVQNNPPSAEIVGEVPDAWLSEQKPAPPRAPDKKRILDALKAGESLDFARINQSKRLVIK